MSRARHHEQPADVVMRDLVDAFFQERLWPVAVEPAGPPSALRHEPVAPGERWCRVDLPRGYICFRIRPTAALQPYRLSRPPVWHGCAGAELRQLAPDELMALLADAWPPACEARAYAGQVGADLRAAVQHAAVTARGRDWLADARPRPGGLLAGERLAATRNRPFHPTARGAIGWTGEELARYGPMRRRPLGLAWVAVRRDRLRHGVGCGSDRLHELLLDDADRQRLSAAIERAGLSAAEVQPLPVHPWQLEHVLPSAFAAELAAGDVVPLVRGLGRFHPTASLRTLTTAPETGLHVKLPLGVATLGAARLLPPRYLANADRAQQLMQQLLERDPVLRRAVQLCDERAWCGWRGPGGGDEFEERPGQLAAQVRAYPTDVLDDPVRLVLPMAALAAHEWDVLGPAIGGGRFGAADAVGFFRGLARAFCELALAFLRYGVLPELHGQNVVVALRDGAVDRFVLRDHDTLRLHPDWMAAAGVADPGYRIRPGAAQSLSLPSAEALVGYLQTLGFQVNLYGIADALCRHYGLDEQVLWAQLHAVVVDALTRLALPGPVTEVLERELLQSATWPNRLVLGPLLQQGRSSGVSMPAGTGRVPNPLAAVRAAVGAT